MTFGCEFHSFSSCRTAYSEMLAGVMTDSSNPESSSSTKSNPLENLLDIREHDVPFHVRVSIDKAIFVGSWYQVL